MRGMLRARQVWLVAVLALVLVLTLSACGARGPGQAGSGGPASAGSGQTATQQSGSNAAASSAAESVQSADQSVQDAVNAMNSVAVDASQDWSTQSIEIQP